MIAPGRVYRSDSDATHTPMFHQVEGLVIDRAIHLGHLKWTLETFLKAFFERDDVVLRMRPSYFPFTEPSAEVDVGWSMEKGRRVVGGSEGWMEVLGSGMVHPRVIANCGLDPDEWQGFAFGTGVDRLAMLKYGMDDLRAFFDGDMRWLKHYGFRALDVPTLSRREWAHEVHPVVAEGASRHRRSAREIADKLTAIGLEVEERRQPGRSAGAVQVAKVLTADKHPQADKLQVLTRRCRRRRRCRSCAARPMPAPGMLGVFGPPGAYVPGSDLTLKVAAIRGVEAHGMMCSVRELQLGDEHDGIIELAGDAPVGASFRRLMPGSTIRCSTSTSRPTGRTAWASTASPATSPRPGIGQFKPLGVPRDRGQLRAAGRRSRSRPDSGCSVFWRRAIRGVRNGPSPEWLQRRLKARRPAPDLGAGRHHQFLLDRPGAAAARLRHRQADGRHHRPPRPRRATSSSRSTARTMSRPADDA